MVESKQIRFVVLGHGRSGSKLLIDLLRSHPDIYCDGEVLNPYFWSRISRHLFLPLWRYYPTPLFTYNAVRRRCPAYGFKLFSDHCVWPVQVVRHMHREGWRFIRTQRRDLLAQIISIEVAYTTHRWHRQKGQEYTSTAVVIPPEALLSRLRIKLAERARIDQVLANISHLDIIYEDDLADSDCWNATSARLLNYLGLPVKTLKCNLVKTWTQPYAKLIANYAELIEAVRQSDYGYLLNHADHS